MAWVMGRRTSTGRMRYTGRYRDANGCCHSAGTAPTRKLALDLARAQEALIFSGEWLDPAAGAMTFGVYFNERWLPSRDVELKTRVSYLNWFTHGLEPFFGDRPLRAITPSVVQAWVAAQRRSGVNPQTLELRFRLLHAVLAARRGSSAIRDRLIRHDPCEGVSRPYVPRREVTIYTPEQVAATIEALGPWYRPLAAFLIETGCRWGESQGLLVADIWNGVANIRSTIVELSGRYTGSPFVRKDYPKGRSRRRLGLTSELSTLVDETISSRSLGPTDRLFAMHSRSGPLRTPTFPEGRPMYRSTFLGAWQRACNRAGAPELRIHDLRASNISWALAGGASIPDVMARVGHSNLATTQRYVKALDGSDQRVLAALRAVQVRSSNSGRSNSNG